MSRSSGAGGGGLRAGAGVVTITPPLGTPLAGHFEERRAETIDDDLTARSLVLDDGAAPLALVVCDLIRLPGHVVGAAREAVAARCGIPAERVMISATHTHTGPVTASGGGDPGERPMLAAGGDPATAELIDADADPGDLAWLAGRIDDAVAVAGSRLRPARLAHGTTKVAGACFNRRYRMGDGTVVFNPGVGNPDIRGAVGPVDPTVTALLVEALDGTPLALWANLALHYVGTDDERAVSADYYGAFAWAVPRLLGDGCVGLLTNGASGDVNAIDLEPVVPARGAARARLVARAVAAAAVNAARLGRRPEAPLLAADVVPLALQRCPISADDVAGAEAILGRTDPDPEPAASFGFVVGQPIPARQARTYARDVLALAAMPNAGTTEIQVMRLGGLALVALPGEIFVELGLAIKAASPFPTTAIVGLANDQVGYVPTAAAFGQGGYETWRTRISWTAAGTGEAMVATALERLRLLAAPASAVPA